MNAIDETTLFMSCPAPDDAHCDRARKEIHVELGKVPEAVGHKYVEKYGRP